MTDLSQILAGIEALHLNTQNTQVMLKTATDRLDSGIKDLQTASLNTARELGGVQSSLTAINGNVTRIEERVASVEEKQANCPARQDIRSVNARLKKVESFKEKIQDERGEVSTVISIDRSNPNNNPSMAAAVATASTKDLILKVGPWLITALLLGAALGGYLLKGFLG